MPKKHSNPSFRLVTRMKPKHEEKLNLAIFIWGICLIGSCWQIFEVSRLYFTYPSSVEMKLERNHALEVPAITLCTPTGQAVDRESLVIKYPKIGERLASIGNSNLTKDEKQIKILNLIQDFLSTLPITDQEEVTVGVEQIIEFCGAARPYSKSQSEVDEPRVFCHQIAPILTSYFSYSKCFTLFNRNVSQIPYIVDREFIQIMINFKINQKFFKHGFLIFHPSNQPPRYSKNNWVGLYPERHKKMFLSFTKTTVQLLPPPYPTKCKSYSDLGYDSREDCIEKCFIKLYIELEERWPTSVASNSSNLMIFTNERNYTNYAIISRYCNEFCGRGENCINLYFEAEKYLTVWRKPGELDDKADGTNICILSPKGMDTTYKHLPKIQLIEYICYVASLISLWFGASARSLFANFQIVFKKARAVQEGDSFIEQIGDQLKNDQKASSPDNETQMINLRQ